MEQWPGEQHRGLSVEQKEELWARWKAGESMSDIGRALNKHPGSIFTFLAVQGGIVRTPRRRAAWALTSEEREQISRGLAADLSIREMLESCSGHLRQSAARLPGMGGERTIGLWWRRHERGGVPSDPRRAAWRSSQSSVR